MIRFMIYFMFSIIFIFLINPPSFSLVFKYKSKKGDEYNLRTFSTQEVLVNNVLIIKVDQKYEGLLNVNKTTNAMSEINGNYNYYSRPYGSTSPYTLKNRHNTKTRFKQYIDGKIELDKQYYYPVVRGIPTFPKKDIKIGDSWINNAKEVQDLKKLNISKPYSIPLTVRYKYLRDDQFRGKDCAVFSVLYTINQNNKLIIAKTRSLFPTRVAGYFNGIYYWDKKNGIPIYYEGKYYFIYILANGQVREFRGVDYGDIIKKPSKTKSKPKKPKSIEKDIKKQLKKSKLNFPVKKSEKGISINLGELLFDFNSTKLKQNTITNLDKLAKILMKYDHLQLTVEGHTDSIGTDEYNLKFSKLRAKKVMDYLIQKGILPNRIKYKGFGEHKPITSNKSIRDRAKNRRVEIIIQNDKTSIKNNNKSDNK